MTLPERITRKILEVESGCWEWQGYCNPGGYGIVRLGGKVRLMHRVMFHEVNCAEMGDLNVLHHCDNPPCCNPDHLFQGTHSDNMQDMFNKGRRSMAGEGNTRSKLTAENVMHIREQCSLGVLQKVFQKKYGMSQAAISNVVVRKTWKHL